MRALIVDDDPGTRRIISLVLQRDFQAGADEAEHGAEALAKLDDDRPYDVIVLDLQMPVMDGVEALAAIRKTRAHADVPVIILTGEASAISVRRVLALGVSGYLTKPVNLGKLSARIAAVRDGGRQPLGAEATAEGPADDPERSVLVVDGDAHLRQAVHEALEGRARVLESETGIHALQVLLAEGGAQPPGLVLIGTGTGLLAGDLLARKVRKLPLAVPPRIVALSDAPPAAVGPDEAFDDAIPRQTDLATLTSHLLTLLS